MSLDDVVALVTEARPGNRVLKLLQGLRWVLIG
jgi:hypothetical protein